MIQAGIFGLGPNSSLNQWTGRDDVSLQLVWQFDAFGIGNLARIKEQRGEQSQTIVELYRTQDKVAAEVTEAQARSPVGGGPGRPGRSLPAHGHHRLQRQRRGPAPDHPLRRRPGPGLPAAGSGLRAAAVEAGLRRVLHHGRRIQPGGVRAVPRAGLPRPRGHVSPAPGQRRAGGHRAPDYLPPVGNGPPPATR